MDLKTQYSLYSDLANMGELGGRDHAYFKVIISLQSP